MSEEKKNGPGFRPGHPRYAGRRKNSVAAARALAEEMNIDPLRFLLSCVEGNATRTIIEGGKRRKVPIDITPEMQIDCAKHVSRFLYPTLSAAQVQAQVDAVHSELTLPIDKVIADPALAESLERLAFLMIQEDTPAPEAIPGEFSRVIGD